MMTAPSTPSSGPRPPVTPAPPGVSRRARIARARAAAHPGVIQVAGAHVTIGDDGRIIHAMHCRCRHCAGARLPIQLHAPRAPRLARMARILLVIALAAGVAVVAALAAELIAFGELS